MNAEKIFIILMLCMPLGVILYYESQYKHLIMVFHSKVEFYGRKFYPFSFHQSSYESLFQDEREETFEILEGIFSNQDIQEAMEHSRILETLRSKPVKMADDYYDNVSDIDVIISQDPSQNRR